MIIQYVFLNTISRLDRINGVKKSTLGKIIMNENLRRDLFRFARNVLDSFGKRFVF